jgi:hypothetical protein
MLSWLKKEFRRILPAFLFFLASFLLIQMTEGRMLKEGGIQAAGFFTILIAAGVVAKVLVLVDHFSFINLFPKKPLIYNVIWKMFVYSVASLFIRLLFRIIPFLWASAGYEINIRNFQASVYWVEFWAIQAWYVMLFTVYVLFRELIRAVGHEKVKRIFFG